MPKTGRPPLPTTVAGIHRCTICKTHKPVTEFYKDRKTFTGYGHRCKPCNKVYKQKYHEDYTKRCRVEILARRKARYTLHREELLRKHRELRKTLGPKWNTTQRAKHAVNPIANMLGNAKRRAHQKGLEFNLTPEDVVVPKVCPVLGIPIAVTPGRPQGNSPSLDRIHNDRGYVRGNVVVVSFKANTIKNNASLEDLKKILAFYEKLL